ncbi:glycosyltransferase family 4 protein [Xanthobacter autotrophicus]|uniref:glycosyltransferase family 4 protein n=1 Tax=Xanthobacter autotrophicus TaxID=280 RepID=UPI001E2C12DF|nr:glycosyltransferase family 4 protein [Xanthobacter autotrophicus]UDQ88166.1 glycosyltransferase family 4 protein [Xanthobacter autotrophicus]
MSSALQDLKVVIVNDMLWGGGRERRIVQLCAGLSRLGIRDITLILFDDRIDYPDIFKINVKIVKIHRKNNRDLSVFLKIIKVFLDIRPDVINPWSYMSVFYAAPVGALMRIPLLGAFVVDANNPKPFSINWFAMMCGFLLCKKIVSNSEAGHRAYGTPANKRLVIHNGFDEARLDAVKVPRTGDGVVEIAMIGRLDRQKDHKTYIDALAILKSRGIVFRAYIAGQGEDLDALKAHAAAKCVDELTFTGFIRDVDSFIAGIDIGVLCTDPLFHAEGISNALLEIMAQGKPVVATYGGGTPEIVTDGGNGFLVPPRDSMSLADGIEKLVTDASLRKRFGENAARTVETRFGLHRMAVEFLEAYRECL